MANTKMTKRDYFAILRTLVEDNAPTDTALLAFIDHEVDLLNKKSSSTKPTKTQTENEDIKTVILETLSTVGKPVTISEMQASNADLANYSNQKLSAIIKLMVDKDNTVVKLTDKKRSLFSVAVTQ